MDLVGAYDLKQIFSWSYWTLTTNINLIYNSNQNLSPFINKVIL